MCPLRLILIFFSATLAGYFAWKSLRQSVGDDASLSVSTKLTLEKECKEANTEFSFRKVIERGFWVFVEMASGSYLWRNLKEANRKAC